MRNVRRALSVIICLSVVLSPLTSINPAFAEKNEPVGLTFGGNGDESGNSICQTDDGSFAVAGYTDSWGAGGEDLYLLKFGPAGDKQWERTIGGSGDERAESVRQTPDGGFLLAGYTDSFGAGGFDAYLVKTDAYGNLAWQKTFGGAGNDYAYAVCQTEDGGFLLAGHTNSFGGDGDYIYLVKTDSTGNLVWQNTYGGAACDYARSAEPTREGAYIVTGYTTSYGAGGEDACLIKVSPSGEMLWARSFGGSGDDRAYSLCQDTDGGYIMAGSTKSFGDGDSEDIYIVKTDASGHLEWQKNMGGAGNDRGRAVKQTCDGGYAILGSTASKGEGDYDLWLLKTDVSGNLQWDKTFGGTGSDEGCALLQTGDEGYILAGVTTSPGAGGRDLYLIRLGGPAPPAVLPSHWEKTYGEDDRWDFSRDVLQTEDGGFMILAGTETEGAEGAYDDIWLIKTDFYGAIEWEQVFGGDLCKYGYSLKETPDGNFVIAGSVIEDERAGIYMAKVDIEGALIWEKTHYGDSDESLYGYTICTTADGGYFITGEECRDSLGSYIHVIKTDALGNKEWDKTISASLGLKLGDEDFRYAFGLYGIEDADGDYIVIGACITGFLSSSLLFIKIGPSGEVRQPLSLRGGFLQRGVSVSQAHDGGYIVNDGISLIKLDPTGEEEWAYGEDLGAALEPGSVLDLFLSVEPAADGGYIATGVSLDPEMLLYIEDPLQYDKVHTKLLMLKLDPFGDPEWRKIFGNDDANTGLAVRETMDGGFIAAGGSMQSFDLSDVYVVKFLGETGGT